MKTYVKESSAIVRSIMALLHDGEKDHRFDAAFLALKDAINNHRFPESVHSLCQNALHSYHAARESTEQEDRRVLQDSAAAHLLMAFERISGLKSMEEFILERNEGLFKHPNYT